MGGSSGGLPTPGDWKEGGMELLKPKNYLERLRFSLDPGGLVYTSSNEDIAAFQAKGDFLNIGAKPTVQTREAERVYESEVAEAKEAAAEEQRLVEAQEGIESEEKRRADRRRAQRISRGSLLSTEDQTGETLG
jgi:hypothetical protein